MNALYKKFPFYKPKENSKDEQQDFAKMYLPSSAFNGDDMVVMDHIDTILKEELGTICSIIERDTGETLEQQYGQTTKTYGAVRIEATRFLINIVSLGNTDYASLLAPCLPTLMKHCVEYPWNSLLHNNVESIFYELFKKGSKYPDEVRTGIIAETQLTDYIASLQVDIKMPQSGRYIRSGVVATFFSVANMLNGHESEYVQEELSKDQNWAGFVETELKIANDNNEQALAGHQSKAGDSDDDISNYETSMDKLFAQFTSLKESHDSSRELEDDEEEVTKTDNILGELEEEMKENSEPEGKQAPRKSDTKQKDSIKSKIKQNTKEEESKKELETILSADTSAKNIKQDVEPQSVSDIASSLQVIEDDSSKESTEFYDNSFWSLKSSFKLEDLLQDC